MRIDNCLFMKKLVLTVIAFLGSVPSFAQSLPFEKLDSISIAISQWQKQTEGQFYIDQNGEIYELSFPAENFKVWSYNKLASHAVYKKQGNREVLALTDNVDFGKASSVTTAESYNGEISYIKVSFPEGSLKTQIIEKGKVVE